MAASTEQRLNHLRDSVIGHRVLLDKTEADYRREAMTFMDEALASHWSWERIGRELGVSGTAVRRYHARNRRKVRSGV